MIILSWVVQIFLIPALSPLCVGLIRKIKARLQNREGASVFQPYRDIWKLLHKDEIISSDASWVFKSAPFIIFAAMLIAGASIPTFASFLSNPLTSDILVLIYILAIGVFFLALAGMDVGGPFGGFGASREMTLAALTEAGLLFSLLALAFISHTTNLFSISQHIASLDPISFLPILIAFLGFFIALLAETARFPFDNPATHLELTMIHEAMIIEYSGKRLALLEWASAMKLLIFISIGASVFFPFGIAASLDVGAILFSFLVFLIKITLFCVVIAIIESGMAKLRFFRLPDLLFTSFILSVIAIGLIMA